MTDRSTGVLPSDDASLAAALAARAGEVLLGLRARVDAGAFEGDEAALRRAGDAASQAWLADALGRTRPADAVLSEEAADDPRRLESDRVWIVDPLDGTREFAEHGEDGRWREDFAVHVALWRRDAGLVAAAVALPALGTVYRADAPPAVDEASVLAALRGERRLRLAASRTRPPAIVLELARREDVEVVPMGSTGYKAMAVVAGRADAYVHAGGQYEWDSAAPVGVATAAGLVATRLDGSPLAYNQSDPWSPDLVICQPALAARLREMLDDAAVAGELGMHR